MDLTVTPVAKPPIAESQSASVAEDSRVVVTLDSLTDVNVAQALVLHVTAGPSHGTLGAIDPLTGRVTYTPTAGYAGPDSFTYYLVDNCVTPCLTSSGATVAISVTAVNQPPTATAQSVTTAQDTPIEVTLSGQSGLAAGPGPLVYRIVVPPAHGAIGDFQPDDGTFAYTPNPYYHGPDSLSFVAIDATEGSEGFNSTPASVTITVAGVNHMPTAEPLAATVIANNTVTLNLVGDDDDPEAERSLTFSIHTQPGHGSVTLDSATGRADYQPDPDYCGSDSFQYTVTDNRIPGATPMVSEPATVSLAIDDLGGATLALPEAMTTRAGQAVTFTLASVCNSSAAHSLTYAIVTAPSHGQLSDLSSSTGQVTYSPASGYSGTDSFTVSVTDNTASGSSTTVPVVVNVTPTGASPVASTESVTVRPSDGNAMIDVLADATTSGSGPLRIVSISTPSHGTAYIVPGDPNASGPAGRDRICYIPASDSTISLEFTYTIEDSAGQESTATVNLTLAAAGTPAADGNLSVGARRLTASMTRRSSLRSRATSAPRAWSSSRW